MWPSTKVVFVVCVAEIILEYSLVESQLFSLLLFEPWEWILFLNNLPEITKLVVNCLPSTINDNISLQNMNNKLDIWNMKTSLQYTEKAILHFDEKHHYAWGGSMAESYSIMSPQNVHTESIE